MSEEKSGQSSINVVELDENCKPICESKREVEINEPAKQDVSFQNHIQGGHETLDHYRPVYEQSSCPASSITQITVCY